VAAWPGPAELVTSDQLEPQSRLTLHCISSEFDSFPVSQQCDRHLGTLQSPLSGTLEDATTAQIVIVVAGTAMATPAALQSAGAGAGLLNLEKELVCFICTEVLYQPLTLIDCLHTFCGSCLKEWFSHQHRKASHSHTPPAHPYTCPTCRATVKDVQHNAMINTLLEMFLAAHPDKNRSAEEKAEMARVYKPGENILPKVESKRRERRRRDEEDSSRRDRRPTDVSRERPRRDTGSSTQAGDRLAPHAHDRSRSASDQEDRRERRMQERQHRREMRDRVEAAEAQLRDTQQPTTDNFLSPPPSSPRHPDAVEARSRARTVAHQASIRSLVSASDSGTGAGDSLDEAHLMQEILAEGLLDGIDIDSLTEAEQDQLSEVIAERYRQLHPGRSQRRAQSTEEGPTGEAAISAALEASQLEEADRASDSAAGITSSSAHQDGTRPPTSNSHTSNRDQTLSPPNRDRAHRRRASDQSGRDQERAHRNADSNSNRSSATRSATDLSDRPRTGATSREGMPRLSDAGRAQTEPRQGPTASELWNHAGVTISRGRANQAGSSHTSPSVQPANLDSSAPEAVAPRSDSSAAGGAAAISVLTSFEEPNITCYRCQRSGIQYEVFKHCSPCNIDLCLKCYRAGRGCNHWFGFGHAAISRFHKASPRNRNNQQIELPHILKTRQYQKPPRASLKPAEGQSRLTTNSDPSSRLLEGSFCDRCGTFANSSFWTCEYCNDGEWGFCSSCVNTHHNCNHPLLPIAHKDFAPRSPDKVQSLEPFADAFTIPAQGDASSANSTHDSTAGPFPDYVRLHITQTCDICQWPIDNSQPRYHCPSHPPTAQNPQGAGDYDICTPCYHNQVKIGRIEREDGPAGWRKCPNGHRMIVTQLEEGSDRIQRRHVVSDLVGGVKMTDEHIRQWNERMHTSSKDQGNLGASLSLYRGKWTWNDPAEAENDSNHRRLRSRQATITPGMPHPPSPNPSEVSSTPATAPAARSPSFTNPKFPPNGGFGKTCVALWGYYPEDGEEGKGELMFPKGAEITEVEEVNEEWNEGVYAGDIGVFANVLVRDIE
jgi:hypothetical protein